MNIVPFSGLRLQVYTLDPLHHDDCQQSGLNGPTQVLDSIGNLGLNRLSCKYFHVIINDVWGSFYGPNSLALLFVQTILKIYGANLEEFVITPEFKLYGTFHKVVQDASFPNMKIFTFRGPYARLDADNDDDDANNLTIVTAVISSAPNLQEIHSLTVTMLENSLKGTSALALPCYTFHPLMATYSESFIHKLRLKHVNMVDLDGCSVDKFNRIVPLLLKTSRVHVKSLTINPIVALPIMGYGICLENVTKLKIEIGWRRPWVNLLEPSVVRLLKAYDFTRIFPKLDTVFISSTHGNAMPRHIREFVQQAKPVLKKPLLPDRAANMKDLSLFEDCLIDDSMVTILVGLFPRIQRLSVATSKEVEISYGLVWEHWMDLEELEIKFDHKKKGKQFLVNLDSVFCGIFPEEVAELRKMDDESLKCVNIVPVMPAFTSLKNLRKFRFVFHDDCDLSVGRRNSRNFLFSRVTGWIACSRCPALSVTIEYSMFGFFEKGEFSPLRHLNRFAAVVPIDYGRLRSAAWLD